MLPKIGFIFDIHDIWIGAYWKFRYVVPTLHGVLTCEILELVPQMCEHAGHNNVFREVHIFVCLLPCCAICITLPPRRMECPTTSPQSRSTPQKGASNDAGRCGCSD